MPAANELIYDNYNALVFRYGPTERASEAFISLALYPRWVTLLFLQGVRLPDRANLLCGSGKVVRSIRLRRASDLEMPEIEALVAEAISRSSPQLSTGGQGVTLIKSVSAKQRPLR